METSNAIVYPNFRPPFADTLIPPTLEVYGTPAPRKKTIGTEPRSSRPQVVFRGVPRFPPAVPVGHTYAQIKPPSRPPPIMRETFAATVFGIRELVERILSNCTVTDIKRAALATPAFNAGSTDVLPRVATLVVDGTNPSRAANFLYGVTYNIGNREGTRKGDSIRYCGHIELVHPSHEVAKVLLMTTFVKPPRVTVHHEYTMDLIVMNQYLEAGRAPSSPEISMNFEAANLLRHLIRTGAEVVYHPTPPITAYHLHQLEIKMNRFYFRIYPQLVKYWRRHPAPPTLWTDVFRMFPTNTFPSVRSVTLFIRDPDTPMCSLSTSRYFFDLTTLVYHTTPSPPGAITYPNTRHLLIYDQITSSFRMSAFSTEVYFIGPHVPKAYLARAMHAADRTKSYHILNAMPELFYTLLTSPNQQSTQAIINSAQVDFRFEFRRAQAAHFRRAWFDGPKISNLTFANFRWSFPSISVGTDHM